MNILVLSKFKLLSLKPILAPLIGLSLALLFYSASRWNLPEPKHAGLYEHAAFLFLLLFILFISYAVFRKKIAFTITLVIFSFVTALLISNWWYFDFYKDYISIRTFSLFKYSSETSSNLSAFPFLKDSIYLVASFLLLIIFHHFFYSKKLKNTYYALAVVSIIIFTVKESKVYGIYGGGNTLRLKHPIVYLLREPFENKGIQELTDKHLDAVKTVFNKPAHPDTKKSFPLYAKHDFKEPEKKHNVLILTLESFRANEVGSYNPTKKHITPNFDKLANSSTLYRNAYANSFQTPRGELAILCSAMDFISGSPYSESVFKSPTKCLPEILASKGYSTHWFHGYNTEFFNRKRFLPKIGIQNIHDISKITNSQPTKTIGWGPSDVDTFNHTISTLEKETSPFIAEVMTLSNHYPFNWDWGIPIPEDIKVKENDTNYDAYQRGIYYTDYALGKFLEKFNESKLSENTILIVTADHGLWLYPESVNNETTTAKSLLQKTDQYFRIPLLIHMPGQNNAVIENKIASQMDIAPTILQLLNMDYESSFMGNSLVSNENENPFVLMYGSGTYHYRASDTLCYSLDNIENKDKTCGKKRSGVYKSCDKLIYDTSKQSCFKISGDSLVENSFNIVEQTKDTLFPSNTLNSIVEFTEYSLKFGMLPKKDNDALLAKKFEKFNTPKQILGQTKEGI